MIPRILVPFGTRPPAAEPEAPSRRRPSSLDERMLIPPALPIVPLDGRTNIPLSLPLESIAARIIIPRDLKWEAMPAEEPSSAPNLPTEMDQRIAVPSDAAPPETIAPPRNVPLDLVDPDVWTTGEVHLIASEQQEAVARSSLITRVSSVLFHALVIVALLLQPKLFPPHEPTQAELELARRQLSFTPLFLPPGVDDVPKVTNPNEPRSERMRIDPRILRQIAPEAPPQPLPGPPEPERVVKELPNAPQPQPNVAQPAPQPSAPAPKTDVQRPPVKLETPDQQETQHGLLLPKSSPGKSIQDSVREAARNSGRSGAISGPMPSSRGAPGGGGAPSQGLMTNGYELLTPTEGVDFSNYLARVLTSVRRNWYAVIPESARLGDRGRVVLQFKIMRPGDVPVGEPALLLTSGKEPLDRAALSAIRTSSPFEPLPPAFSGPFIELRFIFLYNLPLSEAQ